MKDIPDNYPKYVVTLNDLDVGNDEGIKIVHLQDFYCKIDGYNSHFDRVVHCNVYVKNIKYSKNRRYIYVYK